MDSNNSSFNSGQYSILLRTVSELRSEQEKTVSKCRLLEDQNQQLNANYFTVKAELDSTNKKFQDIKEHYLKAVKDKLDSEKAQEALISNLKRQITEKTKEFESTRDRLIPHDIDQLRVKVEEELELRHKQELRTMEIEIEAYRDKCYGIQREMDRMKVEYANMMNILQAENKALSAEKEVLNETWRSETLSVFTSSNNNNNNNDNGEHIGLLWGDKEDKLVRQQTTKIHELSHLLEQLRLEMQTVRSEKDKAVFELHSHKARNDAQYATLRSDLILLESERAGVLERLAILSAENERKEALVRNAKSASEEAYRLKEHAEKARADTERFLEQTRHECELDVETMREAHLQELRDLRESLAHAQTKLHEREEVVRRIHRESSEMQLRAESMEGELRRAHYVVLQETKKRHALTELDLADATHSVQSLQEQLEALRDQLTLEKDSVTSELSRVRREKDVLHGKLRDYETTLESTRKKGLQTQQDLLVKVNLAEKQLREAQAVMASLQVKLDAAHGQLADVEKQKHASEETKAQLHARFVELQERIHDAKKDFQHQMEKEVRAKLMTLKKQWKEEISKEKKRADVYKSKALNAHEKLRQLADMQSNDT
jgi:chromosome segregation ATPase